MADRKTISLHKGTGHQLGVFGVALMYVGAITGAGFASGREIWQFFGVFGSRAYYGIAAAGILFILTGIMTGLIARKLDTNDMGRVIVPGRNRLMISFTGYFMAAMLFTVLITMAAGGGALFAQQWGLSRILGGAAIIIFVIITVIGGFERVSGVFRILIPVLLGVIILVCIGVVYSDMPLSGVSSRIKPSPLAPVWMLSALLYLSYNVLAVIPIVATASVKARSTKDAVLGAALGGTFLAVLAFALAKVLLTDPEFSQAMDMPMLAFSARLSPVVNAVYTCVLLFAIYASATSNYYGFTTKLKDSHGKNARIVIIALLGFFCGLIGFRNVIAYMFPLEGFAGILIIIMLIINFIMIMKDDEKMAKMFTDFEGYDRFDYPEGIVRATAGYGGEATVIFGSEKTALLDCGMAYCGEKMVQNIKTAMEKQREKDGTERTLDYILLSHTHYDHIGALPFVRKEWPETPVCGARHGQDVLKRKGALRVIQKLGEAAEKSYGSGDIKKITTEGMSIDCVIGDGCSISLGKETITVMETRGHTDCSLSFFLEPAGILFTSESTGVLEGPGRIHSAILKSCEDSRKSIERCRSCAPKRIISPHYGIVPEFYNDEYWKLYARSMQEEKGLIRDLCRQGLDDDELLEKYAHKYWDEGRAREQPREAFLINAVNIIKSYKEDF